MATIIADNIISPLGFTTKDTYRAIKSGEVALRHYDALEGIPFGFTASLFSERQNKELGIEGCTRFESIAIRSIRAALAECQVPLTSRTALILSSTKGNIELLRQEGNPENVMSIGKSAQKIAQAVGMTSHPIVVCNACISGVSAIILANRLLQAKEYDYAIVCGADVQSPFILSGFQSLKALSEEECRPFDIERLGLNLGEAAATLVIANEDAGSGAWHLRKGAVRNDAHHITNPSPTGEGCLSAIQETLRNTGADLAQINAHGTATMYNDQMESKAISRAGLSDVPANALKGYFGHTMGAAGIMETILTMRSLDEGLILGTKGFEEIGVSGKVDINAAHRSTVKSDFLKIISGFGGCNGAVWLSRDKEVFSNTQSVMFKVSHKVVLTADCVEVDGKKQETPVAGSKLLTWLYKEKGINYPKYYKMDPMTRLGFIATELLLQAEGKERFTESDDRAVVLFNSTASAIADLEYLKTISDAENYFPSPSLFVYTLPNIITGEIAIRNKYHGETAFYVLPEKEEKLMEQTLKSTFMDNSLNSIITGWLEYKDENDFEAVITIINKL